MLFKTGTEEYFKELFYTKERILTKEELSTQVKEELGYTRRSF